MRRTQPALLTKYAVSWRADGTLSTTTDYFNLDMGATLLENGEEVKSRRWKEYVKLRCSSRANEPAEYQK